MATEKGQVYVCKECDNTVKVVEGGAGMLYCCDMPMKVQQTSKTAADLMQAFGGDFKGRTLQ